MQVVFILKFAIIANEGSFRLIALLVFLNSLSLFNMFIMIGEGFGT
jgi:hypothetical protein